MIKTVTIIDLETTALEPSDGCIIELGAILYSVEHQATINQFSCLFPVSENPKEEINNISAGLARKSCGFGYLLDVLDQHFVPTSEYFVAHGAAFDRRWFRDLWSEVGDNTISLPWLCTYEDFIWPHNPKPTNLINTAVNHGVTVTAAHRALTDCQLIASLFDRATDLQGLFEVAISRANDPWEVILAKVCYQERERPKAQGFNWNRDYAPDLWSKKVKRSAIAAESVTWDFPWQVQSGSVSSSNASIPID